VPGNTIPGYDDHGFAALDLTGRMSGIADAPSTVRTPILATTSNGGQRGTFADATCGGIDDCDLGQAAASPGVVTGIGTGGSIAAGVQLPIDPEGAATAAAFSWVANVDPVQEPGGSPMLSIYAHGPGADGIPGCLGDNADLGGTNTRCDAVLGAAGVTAGSTGTDDQAVIYNFNDGKPANTDCSGPGSPVCGVGERFAVVAQFKVPDPWRDAPILHTSNAIPIKDLDLLGGADNLDVMTTGSGTLCPIVAGVRDCTFGSFCSTQGGDADGDGFCAMFDNCDVVFDTQTVGRCRTGNASCTSDSTCPATAGRLPDTTGECLFHFVAPAAGTNPDEDANGDGIPNACQCADADGTGFITSADLIGINVCVANNALCDQSLIDADNNGFTTSADIIGANTVVNGAPASGLRCARRPHGLPAADFF
jgi:hypothetical protein